MFNITGNVFSFADIFYAGDGFKFFSFDYIRIKPLELICIVVAIFISIITVKLLPKVENKGITNFVCIIGIVICLIGCFAFHKYLESKVSNELTWDNQSINISEPDAYHNLSNSNRALSASGLYQYTWRSFSSAFFFGQSGNNEKISQLDTYYESSPKKLHPSNKMSGIFHGKNLIFIQLESIDSWMITENYMPNLFSIQKSSINFSNFYTPLYISAGTFCTEFISNVGLIPPSTGINPSVYESNYFPYSLANLFNAKGYLSNSYHPSTGAVYNRSNIHQNLGFVEYYDHLKLGMEKSSFDTEMLNGYNNIVNSSNFFSFIITISAHGPYTDESYSDVANAHLDDAYNAINISDLPASCPDKEEFAHAIAQAMETDSFIGGLIDKMTSDGHINDTVLIFMTDHYCKYLSSTQFLLDIKKAENTDMLCNTPFFIYCKDINGENVDKICSSIDIVPTIANLFNLDTKYEYYAGNDIFGPNGGLVIFRGNSWYDGVYHSTPTAEILNLVAASSDTLQTDYFAKKLTDIQ